MLVEETVTYLEMASPDQLVPGRAPPAPVDLEEVDLISSPLARSVYDRIAAPQGWIGRAAWSNDDWAELLSRPRVRIWIARVEGEPAGMLELESQPGGDVGIAVFGLVPEFVGRGYGGHLLSLATRMAWETPAPGGAPVRRVWLQTSSRDHPHALPNYERRGFRPFRTERRRREVPG